MAIHRIPWDVLKRLDGMRGGRYYETPEGERLPSVTNILSVIAKPALINWAAKTEREMVIEAAANLYLDLPRDPKVPPMKRDAFVRTLEQRIGAEKAHSRISKKAADLGSQAHKLIEWNLRRELGQQAGPEPRVDAGAAKAFAGFQEWWRTSGLRPVRVEQMIFHPGKLYAGTLDLLAIDPKDRLGIVDFKTSKAIYLEYLLQVGGAYAPAVDAMGHGPVEWAVIARFPKTETEPEFNPERDIQPVELDPVLFETFCHALDLFNWLQKNDTYKKPTAAPASPAQAVEQGSPAAGSGAGEKSVAREADPAAGMSEVEAARWRKLAHERMEQAGVKDMSGKVRAVLGLGSVYELDGPLTGEQWKEFCERFEEAQQKGGAAVLAAAGIKGKRKSG